MRLAGRVQSRVNSAECGIDFLAYAGNHNNGNNRNQGNHDGVFDHRSPFFFFGKFI